MENASKALLMAGGILTALLVIGALILMFNQLGSIKKVIQMQKKIHKLQNLIKNLKNMQKEKLMEQI